MPAPTGPHDPATSVAVGFPPNGGPGAASIRVDDGAAYVLRTANPAATVAVDRSTMIVRLVDGTAPNVDGSQIVLRVHDDPGTVVHVDRSQMVLRIAGGPVGPRGPAGPPGAEGRSVNVYGPQVSTPRPERRGDVWLVAVSGTTRAAHIVGLDHASPVNAGVPILRGP